MQSRVEGREEERWRETEQLGSMARGGSDFNSSTSPIARASSFEVPSHGSLAALL